MRKNCRYFVTFTLTCVVLNAERRGKRRSPAVPDLENDYDLSPYYNATKDQRRRTTKKKEPKLKDRKKKDNPFSFVDERLSKRIIDRLDFSIFGDELDRHEEIFTENVMMAIEDVPAYPPQWNESFLAEKNDGQNNDGEYCPIARYVPWELQPAYFKWIAVAAGLRIFPQHWNYIWPMNRIESRGYYAKTPLEQTVLYALGYTDGDVFDCCANHYEDFDWNEMGEERPSEVEALRVLGYDEKSWDRGGVGVESEELYWHELSEEQRFAASRWLCWTQLLWDQEVPLPFWESNSVLPRKEGGRLGDRSDER